MTPGRLGGLTLKAALILGFGAMAGLWLFTGYQFAGHLAAVDAETAAITGRYLEAQERLSSVRAQVLVASIYVRDALLDRDAAATPEYRRQLEATYAQIDRDLAQYVPVMSPTGADDLRDLRREIEGFREAMRAVLSSATGLRDVEVRRVLNREVVPRRESVIRVSEEVEALNRAGFITHQRDIASLHRTAEETTWRRLGLALVASLLVAVAAIVYTGRLEARLLRQLAKDARQTQHLRWLSEKLINAQEDERRSIARELHDEVGQLLTAMKVELSVAQRAIGQQGGAIRLLDDAQAIADSALHNVRDLSHLLHPAVLDDLGLSAAIEWYARGVARRYGLNIDVHEDGMSRRLPPRLEVTVYRLVQEALTNVVRHAQARRSVVSLRLSAAALDVTIDDDGRGFTPEEPSGAPIDRGLGVMGMRERVAQMGGTIEFSRGADRGTRIRITLPAEVPAAAGAADRSTAAAPGPAAEPEILGG